MAYDEFVARNPIEEKIRRRFNMKNTIKLGLLTAVASSFLALPVAASAETPSRVELLSTTPLNIEIHQLPIIFDHNPPGDLNRSGDHNPPGDLLRSGDHNPPGDLLLTSTSIILVKNP
jgi:hypothetical protein